MSDATKRRIVMERMRIIDDEITSRDPEAEELARELTQATINRRGSIIAGE